jgi:hypothetical protein
VFTPLFQLAYLSITLTVFSAIAFFTRVPGRRLFGAVCSVAVFTSVSAPIDAFGLRDGFWSYPSCVNPPHPPLAVYVGQALFFVGSLALVGWRAQRRFGTRGTVILAGLVCCVGVVRDLSVAAIFPAVLRFDVPFPASALADAGAWLLVVLVALGVTRLVSGPARAR